MDHFFFFIGEGTGDITWWQMLFRAIVVFFIAVALVRLGGNRIFGKHTVLDIMLAVILGSNFSRALTGNAPFFPVIIATTALVALHALLSVISQKSALVSELFKGSSVQLIEGGEFDHEKMTLTGIGEGDLAEAMRQMGHRPDLGRIDEAYLERNGNLSLVLRDEETAATGSG
ncbi:MAG: DUF421 domain-containing protein [Persicimonas sp.]